MIEDRSCHAGNFMKKIIQAEHLTKVYRKGGSKTVVLQNITFDLDAGKSMSIVGPSGSGKSTLLHILGGLDNPTSGEVQIDGQLLRTLSDKELSSFRNQKIGFVFQFFHLQDYLTAEENIALPSKMWRRYAPCNFSLTSSKMLATRGKKIKEKAKELLDLVGLSHRTKHYPNEMSGGEMQRVAIARALINDPRLILADEPTGNLDKENTNKVLEILEKIAARGVSIVWATHDPRIDHRFQSELRIDKGVVQSSSANRRTRTRFADAK